MLDIGPRLRPRGGRSRGNKLQSNGRGSRACWRGPSGGQLFACSLIMEASCCSKSDSFRSSCARRASASLAFVLRLRKAVAMFLCLTTARTAFATRASASARRCKYFPPAAVRSCKVQKLPNRSGAARIAKPIIEAKKAIQPPSRSLRLS